MFPSPYSYGIVLTSSATVAGRLICQRALDNVYATLERGVGAGARQDGPQCEWREPRKWLQPFLHQLELGGEP
jgi:hypothetical protein